MARCVLNQAGSFRHYVTGLTMIFPMKLASKWALAHFQTTFLWSCPQLLQKLCSRHVPGQIAIPAKMRGWFPGVSKFSWGQQFHWWWLILMVIININHIWFILMDIIWLMMVNNDLVNVMDDAFWFHRCVYLDIPRPSKMGWHIIFMCTLKGRGRVMSDTPLEVVEVRVYGSWGGRSRARLSTQSLGYGHQSIHQDFLYPFQRTPMAWDGWAYIYIYVL